MNVCNTPNLKVKINYKTFITIKKIGKVKWNGYIILKYSS